MAVCTHRGVAIKLWHYTVERIISWRIFDYFSVVKNNLCLQENGSQLHLLSHPHPRKMTAVN